MEGPLLSVESARRDAQTAKGSDSWDRNLARRICLGPRAYYDLTSFTRRGAPRRNRLKRLLPRPAVVVRRANRGGGEGGEDYARSPLHGRMLSRSNEME